MSTTSLDFQIRLTGVPNNYFRARTRQNIKKRFADILYLAHPPNDAVKLAYAASKELTPKNNLFIGDRSDELYANSRTSAITEFIGAVNPINVKSENFLTTQIFADSEASVLPLYYKHVLPLTIIPESVRVLDKDSNEITQDRYRLEAQQDYDDSTGLPTGDYTEYHLYNSLENTYNELSGDYDIYFVQYSISSGGLETVYTEILSNEKAYTQATFEDLWVLTPGQLKPWARAYLLSSDFVLTLPMGAPPAEKFAVRYEETKRVAVHYPTAIDGNTPWSPRIVNGAFRHGVAASYGGGTLALSSLYRIPEFENQAFNPIEPYKLAVRMPSSKVADNLVKLQHEDIVSGLMFSHMYLVFELDGVVKYALTDDSDYTDTDYKDLQGIRTQKSDGTYVQWSSDELLGVDELFGFVHVGIPVDDAYDIYGTYSYKENYYDFTALDLNPLFGTDTHQQLHVVYMVPENDPNQNLGLQTEALQWLKVNPAGTIDAISQDGTGVNENLNLDIALSTSAGYRINGALGLHYNWQASTTARGTSEILPGHSIYIQSASGFPLSGWLRAECSDGTLRYFKYTSRTDVRFILSSNSDDIPEETGVLDIENGTTIELVNFIDERTTLTTRNLSNELSLAYYFDVGDPSTYPSCFSKYFVLAEMTLNPAHGMHDATILDVRQNGGGISDDLFDAAKELNPQVQWISDFNQYNGQPYPGKAVAVIKLPETLKLQFSEDYIQNVIESNIPVGVQPLIRYYGYTPRIITLAPYTDNFIIYWQKEGDEFVYDVWYAKDKNGPWIKHNTIRLVDNAEKSYNYYILSGLETDTKYVIKITMRDKYFTWWYGYTSANSIGGGQGLSTDQPTAPFGNSTHFQIQVTT